MEQTKFDAAIEEIGQGLFEINEEGECSPETQVLLNCLDSAYVLVRWPNSQKYMEEDWFDEEAILTLGEEDKTGSSAYFIPIKRIVNQ